MTLVFVVLKTKDLTVVMPPYPIPPLDRKSTRLNSSHANISYAVFCLKKKTNPTKTLDLPMTHANSPLPPWPLRTPSHHTRAIKACTGTDQSTPLLPRRRNTDACVELR